MTPEPVSRESETSENIIREQIEFSWHGNGCATNVGAEDGGGYCSSNCRQYKALALFDSLVEERDRLREALEAVVARWDEVLPEVNSTAAMAFVHGHRYDGPTMEEPIANARQALSPNLKRKPE